MVAFGPRIPSNRRELVRTNDCRVCEAGQRRSRDKESVLLATNQALIYPKTEKKHAQKKHAQKKHAQRGLLIAPPETNLPHLRRPVPIWTS